MINFAHEFAATSALAQPHLDAIGRKFNLPHSVLRPMGRTLFGLGKIKPMPDGTYRPDQNGVKALIVAASTPLGYGEKIGAWGHDDFVDLTAIPFDAPDSWFCRTGIAVLLGCHNLARANGDVVTLHQTPLDWLRDGGRGLCVLNWQRVDRYWLRQQPIPCASEALRQRLYERPAFIKARAA